ncbi:uncharacterized protein SCHCODRAFT_02631914 [Schizophyllum commune H4-8]|uniref:Uncharacterized protein n=1 Tax=Schizophyllum commune (strain H4-8 / FGSC 9210) TaxID=578458 RepID=D8Q9D6_SCHCM|nr:uncharacterized protein SCHCODRAFT_02631914 [Schizophyllum commune H4-8]KAI5890455.1 hypothetical protein SCHCODRAFT_02631914 [Schizophyllum commune H4-8]
MGLIETLFILIFITELIAVIGKTVLADLAFGLYARVFLSKTHSKQRQLKKETLANKAAMLNTSAQDQFAKWAKLRRSVDKGLADIETTNKELAAAKSAFTMKFNTAIWILTSGLLLVAGAYYRSSPVFFLPKGWFGPFERPLSWPWAPTGSVSVYVYQMACRRVIKAGARGIQGLNALPEDTASTDAPAPDAKKES